MMFRTIKKKRLAILSLTSLLLVSFCLIPCGNSGIADAHASIHGEMHQAHAGEMESHPCHGGDSAGFELKQGGDHGCLHCDTDSPAALVDSKINNLKFAYSAPQSFEIIAAADGSTTIWTDIRPPGLLRPIYILNSTYLI